ncbi:hypothetical protein PF003_g30982 [Phytophthora fragariae]|nr:hypothetical protein PF003_g30982 [Phytophthora fragariae]
MFVAATAPMWEEYDDFEAVLASMVVALATPKTLTEPTDVAVTAPMWE